VISRSTIETINDAAHVEDVVGEFVQLKKRGANMIGLCPFHDEKTPSFVVSPAKGIYKCFGCGKSGDSVKFIMEHETYSYPQALKFLAEKYQIAIEENESTPEEKIIADRRDSLYIVLKYAMEFFQDQLFNTDEGRSIGLSYFKERGYHEETIRSFGLGYSPDSWDALYKDATSKGYSVELLEQAGLIKRKEDKTFDFFRGRVMFPIFNVSGKPVAFGGRVLKKTERAPKYINTPETEVYIKSRIVYGISHAKQEIRRKEETLLVEGYTDVVSLYQAGVKNVVSSSGTSLTPDQVRQIKRFSSNITLLYDGDKAGIKAALRGVDILLEQEADVRVIQLPEGEDPDSYLKSIGSQAFTEYLEEHKRDFVLFKVELLLEDGKTDPIKKAAIIKDIAQSISRISDGIKRSVYVKECSRFLEIDEKLLINETNKLRRQLLKGRGGPGLSRQEEESLASVTEEKPEHHQKPSKTGDFEPLEREVIRLLLVHAPATIGEVTVGQAIFDILKEVEFNNSAYSVIYKIYRSAYEKGDSLDLVASIRSYPEAEIREICLDILAPGYEISDNWFELHEVIAQKEDEELEKVVTQAALRYKSKRFMEMLRLLDEHLKNESDFEKQVELLAFRKKFEAEKNELHEKLGTDILY